MNLRQLISFLSIIFLGLASVSAYIPEHLGGKDPRVQKSNLEMEGAILLREDGTPHCRIGKLPSEDLNIGVDNLDALEECDEGDELYARTILESEEINLGMAAPPGFIKGAEFVWEAGRLAVPMLAIGFLSSCLSTKVDNLLSIDLSDRNLPASQFFGAMIIAGTITVGGIFGGLALVQKAAVSRAVGWALGGVGTLSSGTGLLICGDKSSKTREFETSEEEFELTTGELEISEEEFELTTGELEINEEKLEFIAEEEGVSKKEVAKVLELSRIVLHIERVARDAGLSFEKTKSILYRSCINQAPCFINYPSDLLNEEELELIAEASDISEEEFQRVGGRNVKFTMRTPEYYKHQHQIEKQVGITLSQAFEMMTTEVTQQMWFDVMRNNPSKFKTPEYCDNHLKIGEEDLCPDHPVEQVSWNDVQTYIARRNEAKGLTDCRGIPNDSKGCLRLPTEAEWEYAARGGARTSFPFGDANIRDYAWFLGNSSFQTHPVKTRMANPYGLHDMQGNVSEWVQDFWALDLPKGRDPLVLSGSPRRVIRGGGHDNSAQFLSSSFRYFSSPRTKRHDLGFRLVRNL